MAPAQSWNAVSATYRIVWYKAGGAQYSPGRDAGAPNIITGAAWTTPGGFRPRRVVPGRSRIITAPTVSALPSTDTPPLLAASPAPSPFVPPSSKWFTPLSFPPQPAVALWLPILASSALWQSATTPPSVAFTPPSVTVTAVAWVPPVAMSPSLAARLQPATQTFAPPSLPAFWLPGTVTSPGLRVLDAPASKGLAPPFPLPLAPLVWVPPVAMSPALAARLYPPSVIFFPPWQPGSPTIPATPRSDGWVFATTAGVDRTGSSGTTGGVRAAPVAAGAGSTSRASSASPVAAAGRAAVSATSGGTRTAPAAAGASAGRSTVSATSGGTRAAASVTTAGTGRVTSTPFAGTGRVGVSVTTAGPGRVTSSTPSAGGGRQ